MGRIVKDGTWHCATCGKPLGDISLEEHYRLECNSLISGRNERRKIGALEKKVKELETLLRALAE